MSLKLGVLNNATMTVQLYYYITKTISYVNDKIRLKINHHSDCEKNVVMLNDWKADRGVFQLLTAGCSCVKKSYPKAVASTSVWETSSIAVWRNKPTNILLGRLRGEPDSKGRTGQRDGALKECQVWQGEAYGTHGGASLSCSFHCTAWELAAQTASLHQ